MRCVALVRNVMLGREGLHRELLVRLVEDAGGGEVVSVLTTGNLLFTMPSEAVDPVISQLEADIAVVLGRTEPVVVRTLDWLRSFVQHDPFTASSTPMPSVKSPSCITVRHPSILRGFPFRDGPLWLPCAPVSWSLHGPEQATTAHT